MVAPVALETDQNKHLQFGFGKPETSVHDAGRFCRAQSYSLQRNPQKNTSILHPYLERMPLVTTMIASNTFDEWKRNNSVLTASGLYETTWPQQLALAKQLYDEANGSHPGFVPDDASSEDVIKELQTAEYDAEKIVSWKGISVDWLLDVFCQTPLIQLSLIHISEPTRPY